MIVLPCNVLSENPSSLPPSLTRLAALGGPGLWMLGCTRNATFRHHDQAHQ